MDSHLYWYQGKVLRVVDGDTVDVEFDLGMNTFVRERVRLYGIDTPEIFGMKKESEEFKRGMAAKDFVEARLMNKPVWLHTHKDKTGKYGRYLADIFFQDEDGKHVNIGKLLLEDDLAKEYGG
jgi:micrococcal nuclease